MYTTTYCLLIVGKDPQTGCLKDSEISNQRPIILINYLLRSFIDIVYQYLKHLQNTHLK